MPEKIKNAPSSPAKKPKGRKNSARRSQIALLLVMVASVLSLLAVFSYAGEDEAVLDKLSFWDIFRLPFDDTVRAYAADVHNRFGLIGALVSHAFVNLTFGYASLVLPCPLVVLGTAPERGAGRPLGDLLRRIAYL